MQRAQAVVDPAPQVMSRLVRALRANLHLADIQVVAEPLQSDDVKVLKDLFKSDLVLDVRTMEWGKFTNASTFHYLGRARLVNPNDATVLWEATCSLPALDALPDADEYCAAELAGAALGADLKLAAVTVTGTVPATDLPTRSRIEADKQSMEVVGFNTSAEERADFEKQRAARIDRASEVHGQLSAFNNGKCILFLPVCLMVIAGGTVVASGVQRAKASAREPTLIPEEEEKRLGEMLKVRSTNASLADRVLRLSGSAPVPGTTEATAPRLVVRVKGAHADYIRSNKGAVYIVAEAHAFPAPGIEWKPTEHRYELSSVAWTATDPARVQDEVDTALDALAESIVWTYLSILPTGGSPERTQGPSAAGGP